MNDKVRIGIAGYGNLGRGTEAAIAKTSDMALAGVFTRRAPEIITPGFPETPVYAWDSLAEHSDDIDVMVRVRNSLPCSTWSTASIPTHGFAKTVFDIPPGLLSPRSPEELRAELL